MSSTAHMNIQLINSSDFVDPSVINNGFQKLDALGIDYVTESGKSGEWWYRKWKSGRAECGIDSHTFPNSKMNAWLAGWYLTDYYAFPAFPFAFAAIPHSSIMFLHQDGAQLGGFIHIRATLADGTYLTMPPRFSIADPNGKISYTNTKCSIYTTGRYK